jgi:putative intracellular protease/amidase
MADNATFPRTQRIGIFVYDGFEPLDVFGFVEPFAIARFLGTGYTTTSPYPFETVLIAKERRR